MRERDYVYIDTKSSIEYASEIGEMFQKHRSQARNVEHVFGTHNVNAKRKLLQPRHNVLGVKHTPAGLAHRTWP